MSNEGQITGNANLQKQDLSSLDITKLTPLSPEVISRQATINIGTIGHVAHGKSTVVKAISGVHTVRFKNELERNITIKLERIPYERMKALASSPAKLREFLAQQKRPLPKGPVIDKCTSQPVKSQNKTFKRKYSSLISPDSKLKQSKILDFLGFKKFKKDDEETMAADNSVETTEEELSAAVSISEISDTSSTITKSSEAPTPTITRDLNYSDCESNCSTIITNIKRLNKLVQNQQRAHYNRKMDKPEEYVVERIERIDSIAQNPHFLVKWKGFAPSHNTWEPLAHVKDCEMFKVFIMQKTKIFRREIESLTADIDLKKSLTDSEAFELIKKFDENELQSDLILLAILKLNFKENSKSYEKLFSRVETNLPLFSFYLKRMEQIEALHNWEKLINDADKSSNLKVENLIDFEGPPTKFNYINDNLAGEGVFIPDDPIVGCDCAEACNFRSQCCGKNFNSSFAYTSKKRLRVPPGTPVFECNKRCKCGPECMNRVVQQGRKHSLCIYKTDNGCGWGVRTERAISEGMFICEYVGEIITAEETEKRGKIYDAEGRTYLFDLDINSKDNLYTIDAAHHGNISHFINHSCEPNCGVWAVWIDCVDLDLPKICLFALRRIEAGEELNFDYLNQSAIDKTAVAGEEEEKNGNEPADSKKTMECKCGAKNCRKVLF